MSQIIRKWVQDRAINNEKIDEADIYTMTGLLVDSTSGAGRVGIGITEPLDAIHIRRPDTSAGLMLDLNDGGSGRTYQLYSSPTGVFNIQDHDIATDRFTLKSTASIGNIGISTSDPLDTVHARATVGSAALRLDLDDGIAGQAYQLVSNPAGDFAVIDINDSSAIRLLIDSTGTTTIPGDTTLGGNFQVNGTVTVINTEIVITDQLEINQTDMTQAALIASQDNASATGTVVKIENASALNHALTVNQGFVGFGTTDPQAQLHVEGDIVGKVTATPSNLGSATRRIGTIFMASNINHQGNLNFNGSNVVFDSTAGRVGIGVTLPASALDVVGTVVGSTGIVATTGNIAASSGSVTAFLLVSAGTTVTAGTGITATTGNITASTGNIVSTLGALVASTTVTAGGLIRSTGGGLQANTTVIAGTGMTATTGNITASTGNIVSTLGALSANTTVTAGGLIRSTGGGLQANTTVTAGTGITATTGNITASTGNFVATLGSVSTGSNGVIGTWLQVGTNCGIGTTSPFGASPLHVYRTGTCTVLVQTPTTVIDTDKAIIQLKFGASVYGQIQTWNTTANGSQFDIYGTAGVALRLGGNNAQQLYLYSNLARFSFPSIALADVSQDGDNGSGTHSAITRVDTANFGFERVKIGSSTNTDVSIVRQLVDKITVQSASVIVTPTLTCSADLSVGTTSAFTGNVGIGTVASGTASNKLSMYSASGVICNIQSGLGNFTNFINFKQGASIGSALSVQSLTGPTYTGTWNMTGSGGKLNLSVNNNLIVRVWDAQVGINTDPPAAGGGLPPVSLEVFSDHADGHLTRLKANSGDEVKLHFIKGTTIAAVFISDPTSCKIGSWDEAQDTKILHGGNVKITATSTGCIITGALSKSSGSFIIDHPLDPYNKTLQHSFVESPEMRNIYYGQAETVNGFVTITLPYWWTALNGEDKSEYSYQFTSIGKWCPLYVSQEIEGNKFTVASVDGDCKFSWTVSAIRHDKHAEEHRISIEEEKVGDKKGILIEDYDKKEN